MASYQIPQFLDSGDKIFLSMNLRQFGYAIGFGMASFLVFQTSFSLFPQASWFNLVPAAPFALLGTYLALGKYNSRDAEVYVLQSIIYLVKPRKLLYVRVPDIYDLEEKLGSITANNVAFKMKERLAKSIVDEKGPTFDLQNRDEKAKTIMQLAQGIDSGYTQALGTAARLDLRRQEITSRIQAKQVMQKQTGSTQNYQQGGQALVELANTPYEPSQLVKETGAANEKTQATFQELQEQNFFNDQQQYK